MPLYRLTLRAMRADTHPIIRLRKALKALKRAYRFSCILHEEVQADESSKKFAPKAPKSVRKAKTTAQTTPQGMLF